MSDDKASQLLALLCEYFEAYPDEKPQEMTAADLAGDLLESLPYGNLRESRLDVRFASVVMP